MIKLVEPEVNIGVNVGSGKDIASGILDGIVESFKRYAVEATKLSSEASLALCVFLIFLVVGLRFWRMA